MERFADIQILQYHVDGFEKLSLSNKKLIYCLTQAALSGRDILFDQNGAYNLRIRRTLEAIYSNFKGDRSVADFKAMEVYLKRVWFSSGIHHHYGCEKFIPQFSESFLKEQMLKLGEHLLPVEEGQTAEQLFDELRPVIFDPEVMPKRVNLSSNDDLLLTSACNYYKDVKQEEAEAYYNNMRDLLGSEPISAGLNSRLKKAGNKLIEEVWKVDGLYTKAIEQIVIWLEKAMQYAENDKQKIIINTLIGYYRTGDLKAFDDYSIKWVKDTDSFVDFTNGFIETYGDPLGLKGSWESIVDYKDIEATHRTEIISSNAQWFEDHSPIDDNFKKKQVTGVSAKVITAAILAGDLYPSTAIGINLPNAEWIRAEYGSKSVTIGNITAAYNKASHNNGFMEEFVYSNEELKLIEKYSDITDELHTDLHECLGHGSGILGTGVSQDALKSFGSTIEEARADLFGLYYVADKKLIELGLLPDENAYKAQYYTYMMNGLMTQLVRIKPGHQIEEAHMRNRQLIARWVYEKGKKDNVVEFVQRDGKTFIKINDYNELRNLYGQLLHDVQSIKSTGNYDAARQLVEDYGVQVDPTLHSEVLERYEKLNLSPYKGFVNPVYKTEKDEEGNITDITVSYDESYVDQMMRYSKDYSFLPSINEID